MEIFGEVGKEGIDFGGIHERWMLQFMELDEPFDPIRIGLGSFGAHMAEVCSGAELVEEFRFA